MNGGHEDDVNGLLEAVLAHSWRRKFPDHPKDRAEREDAASDNAARNRADWFKRLAPYWPARPARGQEEPLPKTVSEIARANVRELLWDRFEEFMGDVEDLGDVVLLSDTLSAFSNGNTPLAEAFQQQIDQSAVYIKIPERDAKTIQGIVGRHQLMKDRIAELEAFARRVKLITPQDEPVHHGRTVVDGSLKQKAPAFGCNAPA